MKRDWGFVVAVALAGCVSSRVGGPAVSDYRYIVLGPDGVAVARVVTAAGECPAIEIDGVARPMSVRMPAETIPVRPSRSDLPAPKPSAFPVTTCEATVPASAQRASVDGQPLPLPKADPKRIILIGDTGCLVNSSYKIFQACNDPVQWPFERVANAAAAMAPDLVIHVGDYHYRESACEPGNAGCADSPWGYGYDAWRADLFQPARMLMAAAPWIVVRGNHESCNRAGQGWWRFMDPRPLAPKQDCNDAANDDIGNYGPSYAVPLGRNADTQFLVFDSSWVGVVPLKPDELMYRNYRAELTSVFAQGARTANAFFLSHHPVLGFAANPGNPQSPYPGNAGLQSVLQPLHPGLLFPDNVAAVLAGHNHTLEIVSFASGHPPQFITGNGGDWPDQPFPVPFPSGLQPAPGAVIEEFLASTRFGYMTMERSGSGWRLEAFDANGASLTTCQLASRKATCAPIADPYRNP
jgi:hypothetical protein